MADQHQDLFLSIAFCTCEHISSARARGKESIRFHLNVQNIRYHSSGLLSAHKRTRHDAGGNMPHPQQDIHRPLDSLATFVGQASIVVIEPDRRRLGDTVAHENDNHRVFGAINGAIWVQRDGCAPYYPNISR